MTGEKQNHRLLSLTHLLSPPCFILAESLMVKPASRNIRNLASSIEQWDRKPPPENGRRGGGRGNSKHRGGVPEHTLLIAHCVWGRYSHWAEGKKGAEQLSGIPLLENSEAGIGIQPQSVVNSPAGATGRCHLPPSDLPRVIGKTSAAHAATSSPQNAE